MTRVGAHELVVAALIGAAFGVAGYYLTRKIEAPVASFVDRVIGD